MAFHESMDADDTRPFLDNGCQSYGGDLEKAKKQTQGGRSCWVSLFNALPWLIIVLLSSLLLIVGRTARPSECVASSSCHSNQLLYSPAQSVVEYEIKRFRLGLDGDETEYQGDPSPELDQTWNALYEMGISLIPLDMASKIPNKTVIFPHDRQRRYIIELDVFHQLHCLNMIRKALHPEYYHPHIPGPNPGDEDELLGPHHIDHCVDAIRQSLMCNADISVLTWLWDASQQRHFERGTVLHTCKRFDKIQEWARARAVYGRLDTAYREMNDPLDPETWT